MKGAKADFDTLLLEIGEFGRWQKWLVFLLIIPGCIMNAYNGYALVFIMYTPEHTCKLPSANSSNITADPDITVIAEQCTIRYERGNTSIRTEKCQEWDYSTEYFTETLITKFNLVCDAEIEGKVVLSIIGTTTVLGCLMYSYIADRWGRKIAFEINLITFLVGGILSLFMPTLATFTVFRCLASINGISTWNICFMWSLEYTGPSKRTLVSSILVFAYAIGMASMSILAYFVNTFVQMGIVTTVPFVLLISYHWLVDESARWLLSKGRTEEVTKILHSMIKTNTGGKKSMKDFAETIEALKVPTHETKDEEKELGAKPPSLMDLFRTPNLRMKTILVTITFISAAVSYTTMAFYAEKLEANFYLTWSLQSLAEGPAGIANLMLINRFGRIRPLAFSAISAGFLCLLTIVAEEFNMYLVLVCAILGKFGICMTYGIIFQLSNELFPTVLRGLGMGFGSIMGDVGNVAMPYIILSARAFQYLPMIVLGLMDIVGGCLSLFLPETRNTHLPQSIEDAENTGVVSFRTLVSHFRPAKKTPDVRKRDLERKVAL